MALRNASSVLKPLNIPKRIPRSKTDILKALSATVGLDPTAPRSVFIDDPRLIPTNNLNTHSYVLSKDSGIRAAKYFFEKFPHLFHRDESEPKIDQYIYKEVYDDTMDLNEVDLLEAMEKNQWSNAKIAYQHIVKNNKPLSDDAKVNLIQFLFFFIHGEPEDSDLRIKSDFSAEDVQLENLRVEVDTDEVIDIFETIKNKDKVAYSSLIVGLSNLKKQDHAAYYVEKAKSENIGLTVEAFNGVIRLLYVFPGYKVWDLLMKQFETMAESKISPNLETFTFAFEVINRINESNRIKRNYAARLMGEMKSISLEPDLYIYFLLLKIFCKGQDPRLEVLLDILHNLETRKVDCSAPESALFPSQAMKCCHENFPDIKLGYRLHKIFLQRNDMATFMNNNPYSKRLFFIKFFDLLMKVETMDNIMLMYERYVPNSYTPHPSFFGDILECIKLYQAYHYLPRVCSDFLLQASYGSLERLAVFVDLLTDLENLDETTKNYLSEFSSEIVSQITERRQRQDERDIPTKNTNLYFEIHLQCLQIYLLANDISKASELVKKIARELPHMTYDSKTRLTPLSKYVDMVLDKKLSSKAKDEVKTAVKIACHFGETSVLKTALQISEKKKLSEDFTESLMAEATKYKLPIPTLESKSEKSDKSSHKNK